MGRGTRARLVRFAPKLPRAAVAPCQSVRMSRVAHEIVWRVFAIAAQKPEIHLEGVP